MITESMAKELALQIERERMACRAEVRQLMNSHNQHRWFVWVTNHITGHAVAVFHPDEWPRVAYELV